MRRRRGRESSLALQWPAVDYLHIRREVDLPILEVESVRQACVDLHLFRNGLAPADQFLELQPVEDREFVAFHNHIPGRKSFQAEGVPSAQLFRDVVDRDVWKHETARLGDATSLHDGFPGAWDDLRRVIGSRRLELGLRGRHGFKLIYARWGLLDAAATA
jgi:hypothetical protein